MRIAILRQSKEPAVPIKSTNWFRKSGHQTADKPSAGHGFWDLPVNNRLNQNNLCNVVYELRVFDNIQYR